MSGVLMDIDAAIKWLRNEATRQEAERFYLGILRVHQDGEVGNDVIAHLAKHDRYFLTTRLLGRKDLRHDWQYARAREVENSPDGYLDLWAR